MIAENLALVEKLFDDYKMSSSIINFHVSDPVFFPKQYSNKLDIEISAFIASILALGPRYAIIRSLNKIFDLIDDSPFDFIVNFDPNVVKKELAGYVQFAYKNIYSADVIQILYMLKLIVLRYGSLELALMKYFNDSTTQPAFDTLSGFLNEMKSQKLPKALGGKVTRLAAALLASPDQGSACKRMNMFLRWMVRKDEIDFGIYDWFGKGNLIIPLDVNVSRAARKLGIIKRKADNWKTAVEITEALKELDPHDPVKYDIPLFLYGIKIRKSERV
ncbi:MAG: TIGR02757 family protein [Candidatus Kryptoniota bacterium]